MHSPDGVVSVATRLFSVLAVLLLLAACRSPSMTPTPGATNTPVPATARATGSPTGQDNDKIDRVFFRLLSVYQTQGLDGAKQFARDQGLLTTQDEVRITLVLDSDDAATVTGTVTAIERLGGRVTTTVGNTIELVVPAKTLVEYAKTTNRQSFFNDLADFQHVQDVQRTPTPLRTATPTAASGSGKAVQGGTSEGVALTGADKWQAAGITGKGVKVGIIDGAFSRYQQFLSGAKVTTRSFRADGLVEDPSDEESIHGTACAEIVHEMAPDAEIYLASFDTPGQFVMAIRWLVSTVGVSVVSTSIGFDGQFPLDGSGSMAKEIDRAKAAGVFFAISAGNEASGQIGTDVAEGHFAAPFQDRDGDGFHDFAGARTRNGLQVRVGNAPVRIVLNWDDWQRPHINYDLFLYDASGNEVGRSDNDQSTGRRSPVEGIFGTVKAGTYVVKVKKVNRSDPDVPFNLFFSGCQFEQVTPPSSLSTPADARGAFTVAAIDLKTGKLEDFSSEGATLDGRAKPEISGPDNTTSFAYASIGQKSFSGTSAATPHVAGAAALYKQAFPDATPDAIFQFFTAHARKPEGTRQGQNVSGAGLLFLDVPPRNASLTPVPSRPPASATAVGTPVPAGTAFTDDFSSPSTGLPPQAYQNGAYRFRVEAGSIAPATYPRVVRGAASETYEVQVQKTAGADDALMGLEIRRLDASNYLLFTITNDGLYGVFLRANGTLQTVGSAGASAAIKRDARNDLRVVVTGTQFTFSVNGQTVSQFEVRDLWTQGTFGIIAGGGQRTPADVAFTNYRVTVR